MSDDDDIAGVDARPSILATLAGVVVICSGLTALVSCFQLWTLFYLYGWRFYALIALALLTVVQMGFGGLTLSGSDWATIATTGITWLVQLCAVLIVGYAVSVGLLAPLLFIWVFVNGLTSLLVPCAIPAALRTSANRRKLYAL